MHSIIACQCAAGGNITLSVPSHDNASWIGYIPTGWPSSCRGFLRWVTGLRSRNTTNYRVLAETMKRSYWKMWNGGIQSYLCSCHVSTAILIYQDGNARQCEPYSCPSRVHRDSHTMLKYINHWRRWFILVRVGPSHAQRCSRCGGPRLKTLSLLRIHLILTKLPVYSTQSLKSWRPVLIFEEMRYIPFAYGNYHTYQFVNCWIK